MTSRTDGFTLVELLLVIVILGVLTAVVVPLVAAGSSGTRLATAARATVQAARYARTMALLNQAETMLVIDAAGGVIRVEAAPPGGERTAAAAAVEGGVPAAAPAAPAGGGGQEAAAGSNRLTAAAVTAGCFADELRAEYRCPGVRFRFLGYSDRAGGLELPAERAAGHSGDAAEVRIRYGSNGLCRPFRLRVMRDEQEWLDIAFDMTGGGKVLPHEA
jgi:prepilin-type N-terminal cleavage/methylation domain-containing protein